MRSIMDDLTSAYNKTPEYAHGFIVLCFVVDIISVFGDSLQQIIHKLQGLWLDNSVIDT